jgi:hypothetical protein
MRTYSGWVKEIQLDHSKRLAAWIVCPPGAIPAPGQYLLAYAPDDTDAVLGTPLFSGDRSTQGFLALPPIPGTWEPGRSLVLRGPIGHGFFLPNNLQRLAIISFGETVTHLLPLAAQAMREDCDIAIFMDGPMPPLPTALEAHPLSASTEVVRWADFLAIAISLESLPSLRTSLGLSISERVPCPAQALIQTPMPCASLAECGACAVPARRGWKLACKDGPVFDLENLKW